MKNTKTKKTVPDLITELRNSVNVQEYLPGAPGVRVFIHDMTLIIFIGRRKRPDLYRTYDSELELIAKAESVLSEARVMNAAAEVERARVAAYAVKNRAAVRVGDVFHTSWGYDQTNVDFFEVTERPSQTRAVVRKIDCDITHVGNLSYKLNPNPGCSSVRSVSKRYLPGEIFLGATGTVTRRTQQTSINRTPCHVMRDTGFHIMNDYTANDYTTHEYNTHDHTANDYTTHEYNTHDYTANDYTTHEYNTHDHTANDYTTHEYNTHDHTANDYTTHEYNTHDYSIYILTNRMYVCVNARTDALYRIGGYVLFNSLSDVVQTLCSDIDNMVPETNIIDVQYQRLITRFTNRADLVNQFPEL